MDTDECLSDLSSSDFIGGHFFSRGRSCWSFALRVFKFSNGQIWQQAAYAYTYHYAFRPKVILIKTHGTYKMKVDGVNGTIFVKQLK